MTTSNELPNLKTGIQTRSSVSLMLEKATMNISNANPNESEIIDENSNDATSTSLHRHHWGAMLSSKPRSMVEAYRTGVYFANCKDTAICL